MQSIFALSYAEINGLDWANKMLWQNSPDHMNESFWNSKNNECAEIDFKFCLRKTSFAAAFRRMQPLMQTMFNCAASCLPNWFASNVET